MNFGELQRAVHRIARARLIVEQRRKRIAQLVAEHQPSEDAQRQLEIFTSSLADFEEHERLLRDEIAGKDRTTAWLHSRIAARAHLSLK